MINFKDEDEPQNETVRQTLERVAREYGVFGTTPTNNITHSPQSPTQQPTAWSSSPNYSATAANNWQIQSTTAAPQNSNTFGSTQQPSQPAGFTPSPIQPMSQTPAAVANQIGQSSGSTSLFDNPDAIKQQNGQPSPVMQAIYRYLANTYGQQNIPNIIGQNSQRTVYRSLTGFRENQQQWHENNPQQGNYNYVQDEYEKNPLVNDCLKSERYKTFIDNIKKPEKEGLGFHISDQATNSGISQGWYDDFLKEYPTIAKVYPSKVKNLTQEQVDNLYCQGFYKPNHIETFNDNHIAEQIFDIGVNIGGPKGIPIIQNAYNDISNNDIRVDNTIGTETVSAINRLRDDELLRLNNQMVDRRLKYYDGLRDKDEYPGWYTRAKSFRR